MASVTRESRPAFVATALAFVFATAFVVAPAPVAALGPGGGYPDEPALAAATRTAFAEYWRAGGAALTPAMQHVADYWSRYHLVKAVTAALLLGVLLTLTVRLWTSYVRTGRHRALHATGGALTSALALGAALLVVANVQGAVNPFTSLLPLVVDGPPDAALTGPLQEIRRQLAAVVRDDARPSPLLGWMLDDYAAYHWVVAALAVLVAVACVALSVALWRRFPSAVAPARRVLAVYGTVSALTAAALALLIVANVGTAADPAPGFLGFFEGGW